MLFAGMPTLWTSHGPGGGGAFFQTSIAPNGRDLWINSDMSGIYHSGDFGHSWQMKPFHAGVGGISGGRLSQVIATSDPNVLYIANSRRGMVRSNDGGTSWSSVAGWWDGDAYWMTVDPANPNKILAANWDKLYLSTNGGVSFDRVFLSSTGGLYVGGVFWNGDTIYLGTNLGLMTSTDGAANFGVAALPHSQPILSFAGARQGATTRLIAITTPYNPSADNLPSDLDFGELYSLDVGGRWTRLNVPSGNDVRFVAMARNNISIAYLGGQDTAGMTQVLKTSNGGTSWSDVFRTGFSGDGVSPNDNIYSGYEGRLGDFDYWWGGLSFGFSVAPNDANRVIISDAGFIHTTTDGGTFWHQAYTSTADENQPGQLTPKHKAYHGVGIEDTSTKWLQWMSPSSLFAGFTDTIGFRSTDGGASWAAPDWSGLATNTIYNTTLAPDGKLYAAASKVHDMYMAAHLNDAQCNPSTQDGRVIVSADQGATWSLIHDFGHPVVWVQMDPANSNRMYAAVVDGPGSSTAGAYGGIWVTNNLYQGATSTWTKLASPPRTEGHPYSIRILNDGALVVSYSARRAGNPEAFTRSSGVFYSTDGGLTWQDRTLIDTTGRYGAADMSYYTRDVMVDPTDPTQNTWYAGVFNGWGGKGNETGDVYRTTDRGITWTRMELFRSTAYPNGDGVNVQAIAINPSTREIYVTTDGSGILYAPDASKPGLSYTDFGDLREFPFGSPEHVFVNPYDGRDIWVTTFGGGIWEGGVGPDGVTATALGGTQVQVRWADNSANEAGFEIDRATDAGFTQNLSTTSAGVNATSATIGGLSPGVTYYFRVRAVNGLQKSANSAGVSVVAGNPVTVSSFVINQGATQRSRVTRLDVSFNTPVILGSGAFALQFSSGAAVADTAILVANPSGDLKSYVLSFGGSAVIGGSLGDGVYDLIVHGTQVSGMGGGVMTGDFSQRFHRLFGDSDGNRIINSLDYARLKQTFGRAPSDPLFNSAFDYEGNGLINALDLARFRQRYGMSYSY